MDPANNKENTCNLDNSLHDIFTPENMWDFEDSVRQEIVAGAQIS